MRFNDIQWMDDALCAEIGPHPDFFPKASSEKGTNGGALAKKICAECPVIAECLQYALDNDIQDGVWGGTTIRQRRLMKRFAA